MTTHFGAMLREWRETRKISQLDLGLSADVSARHISFLETGRARPSRAMVLNLGAVLDVPRVSRNTMLHAAGFAPNYRARENDEAEMVPINAALEWMLERHMPYPAMVLDRHWKIVRANAVAEMMLGQMGLTGDVNLIEAMLDETGLPSFIENWQEVARHLIQRLQAESAHLGGDAWLDRMAARLTQHVGGLLPDPHTGSAAVIPTRYRLGDVTLSFFSTISQFSTAEDIALADCKIEHLFPADAQTTRMMASLAQSIT